MKVDPLEARPELTPVAYLVERQISGGAFENISETLGEPDILDKIGILPAVYFPARATPPARSRCASPTTSSCRTCSRLGALPDHRLRRVRPALGPGRG